jgi:hypothetical protein
MEHYIYLSSLRKCSSVESNGIFHTTVLKDKIMLPLIFTAVLENEYEVV